MKELNEFLHVVGINDFVEGHEVLEVPWKKYKKIPELKEESLILKGLINGSTALALKVKGKDEPAIRVWATFLKYLPLIETIKTEHTFLYKKARDLLLEKNLNYKIN